MIRIIAYALAAILATLILGTISPRLIEWDTAQSVIIFGLVIGLIDAAIKPFLRLLTLPITCLTFGLFALVLNVLLFRLGAEISPGITVSWWGAITGAILVSLTSGLIYSVLDE